MATLEPVEEVVELAIAILLFAIVRINSRALSASRFNTFWSFFPKAEGGVACTMVTTISVWHNKVHDRSMFGTKLIDFQLH